MEANPFPELKISSSDFLDLIESRQLCCRCNKSRRYFCYTCFVALPSIVDKIPNVKLPFKVDIIKHHQEVDGKSTAAHAAVLASKYVTVYQFPDFPDYCNNKKTVLVFPGPNAISIQQVIADNLAQAMDSPEDTSAGCDVLDTIVFIDCTWCQVYKIATDERLKDLQRIELTAHKTRFWRHQLDKPDTYLSTIEAIYYCAREYHESCSSRGLLPEYDGEYDDILFFFVYFYRKIQTLINDGKTLKAYHGQRRKAPRVIQF